MALLTSMQTCHFMPDFYCILGILFSAIELLHFAAMPPFHLSFLVVAPFRHNLHPHCVT
jgi:hypothetical protein